MPAYDVTFSATRYVSFERVTRNRVHRHSFFEPCIVISGAGEFEHGSEVHSLREGTLFLADPGVYHEIRSLRTRDLKLYFLGFNVTRNAAQSRFREHAWFDQPALASFVVNHRVHVSSQSRLIPLFEHTMKLSRQQTTEHTPRFYREASLLLISQIVAALAYSPASSDESRSDEVLSRRVAEVIEEGLHQPLRTSTVAAQCNMSERTLRRKWRLCTGRPLIDEVRRRRIERAKHLLLIADISVSEVGYQVGIESPAQFSRMFKTLAGMTPTAYRDKYLRGQGRIHLDGPPFRTEFLDGKTKEYRR